MIFCVSVMSDEGRTEGGLVCRDGFLTRACSGEGYITVDEGSVVIDLVVWDGMVELDAGPGH